MPNLLFPVSRCADRGMAAAAGTGPFVVETGVDIMVRDEN